MAEQRKRSFWGWGYEDQQPNAEQLKHLAERMAKRFGLAPLTITPPPREDELKLRAPRIKPPDALAAICSTSTHDRAGHSYGRSYRDVVRAYRRFYPNPFDAVAFPRDEAELTRVLEWCDKERIAATPYGGGSSVVGGVEPPAGGDWRGSVSIDLTRLDRVLEVDHTSRAARIQGGVLGPSLEDQLRPHNYTLRHYPQSFEFSTLGGWIATRSGGHFATLYTHIDDFVESVRVLTPTGIVEIAPSARLGRGPESRPHVHRLGGNPRHHHRGVDAPAGPAEVSRRRVGRVSRFHRRRRARCARSRRPGCIRPTAACSMRARRQRRRRPGRGGGAGAGLRVGRPCAGAVDEARARNLRRPWRKDSRGRGPTRTDADARTRARPAHGARPSSRRRTCANSLAAMGIVTDTFETAITWDRFPSFHAQVMETGTDAIRRICGKGTVTCRFTHAYPDGPAPYYTILAPGKPRLELEQWDEIKAGGVGA